MTPLGIGLRLAVLAGALLGLAPLQYLGARRGWPVAKRLPILVHRLFLRLFSVRVGVVGAPAGPALILANHVSWLDISVLSSLGPVSFVAKSEIAGWPLFGTLARLQRSVFLDRSRRGATAEVNAVVSARLAAGESIVLFAEGTTGDGIRLLPFRSSLVGAARAAPSAAASHSPGGAERRTAVRLQPVALVYAGRSGLPVVRREMPGLAWYGDMELPPHLASFVRGGPVDVVAVWGEPITLEAGIDRKRATAAAEAAVRDAIAAVRRTGTGPLFSCGPDRNRERDVPVRRPERHRLA